MKRFLQMNHIALLFAITLTWGNSIAQTNVEIDISVQRYLDNITELDRTKFFSIHSGGNDAEHTALYNDYNVNPGRGFWGPFSYAKGKTGSVGVYPNAKSGNTDVREVNSRVIATEHPRSVFKDGLDPNLAANWAVEYYKNFVDKNGRPEFFELMNEPFVHAKDFYSGGWSSSENDRIKLQMAKAYNAVGAKFHATPELANMKILGYSSAWPSLELNDFGHWGENMKMFMDQAGANMDAFSTHLYDGVNVEGQDNKRSGSNSEAILDLIETYSYTKWNAVMPHAISEYGAIEKGYGDDYSDLASIQTVRAINHILFNLLDREDRMVVSIPFITGKAEWHINEANNYQPYQAVLWKPTNIGEPTPAGWEYSPRIKFYELWKDVKGKRVFIKSDNPDVQTQAFVDGNKLFVAMNNLDDALQTINLNMLTALSGLQSVRTKSLKIYPNDPHVYSDQTQSTAPTSLQLVAGETTVLEYTFNTSLTFNKNIRSKNYYTSKHLQAISANSEISFTFNNVETGEGYATLKMGIGRKHNVSKKPIIKVNGTTVAVPSNWKGYDQANRDDFFGVIDIPVPANLIQANNTVTIKFPDNGGRISSLILNVQKFEERATNSLGFISSIPAEVSIYPNPVYDVLNIHGDLKCETLKIIDITGTTLQTLNAKGIHELVVSDLPNGMYLLITDTGRYHKFIKG